MSKQFESCPQCGREELEASTYQVLCRSCGWSVQAPDPRYVAHVDALGWETISPVGPIVELLDGLPSGFASTLTTTRSALPTDHALHDPDSSFTAAEFRNRRELFGLSAEWLAERLGVALKTVQRWENGHRRIPHGVFMELDIISTARFELMARPWAEHLLEADDAVMMIPRTGTHLGLPASWYRTLVDDVLDILMNDDEYQPEGLAVAGRLRVVYFDDVEEQR